MKVEEVFVLFGIIGERYSSAGIGRERLSDRQCIVITGF